MHTLPTSVAERSRLLGLCDLFRSLPEPERAALASIALHRTYEAGEYLFMQEEPAQGFYVVVKGRIKVHRLSPDGREQVLHLFGRGELCGEVPVFAGTDYPASAAASGVLEALFLPRERFLAAARRQPQILLDMLAELSRRLRGFVTLIDDLSLKEVSARLAKYLLDLTAHTGAATVELDSSKAVLAARLGTIAETLSRTLKKMQQRKAIAVQGHRIRVLNRDLLIELAGGLKL